MDQSQLTFLGYGVLIGLAVASWVARVSATGRNSGGGVCAGG